jgi:hypothetical protein
LALAGNASALFADLVQAKAPDQSWDIHAQKVVNLSARDHAVSKAGNGILLPIAQQDRFNDR